MNPLNLLALSGFPAGDDLKPSTIPIASAMREAAIVIGAILFVASCVTLGFVFLRRRPDASGPRRHRRHRHGNAADQPGAGASEMDPAVKERKRRRRRREHRPRNPTLAETGGLPPLRRDEPPAPPPSPSQSLS